MKTLLSKKGQIEDAANRRGDLKEKADTLLSECQERGGMTDAETATFDGWINEIEATDRLLQTLQKMPSDEEFEAAGVELFNSPGVLAAKNAGGSFAGGGLGLGNPAKATGPVFKDDAGNRIQGYAGTQPIAQTSASGELGDAIHRILRGDLLNVNVGSTDSAGGYIINPEFSTRFIDLARSASVCMRAGAVTLPMESSELVIAGLASDPTSHWRAETVAVPSTEVTFNRIALRAKTLAAIVPVSIEMLEDARNAAQIIEAALMTSMGQKLDAAGLVGTGAEQNPKGIRNHAGVNTIASVGTPADYSNFSLAVGDVMAANYPGDVESLAWVNHPRTDDTLDNLQDTTNQPMLMTPRVSKLQRFSTTALPIDEGGGSDESVSVVGDFTQLAFGMRTRNIVIRILDAGTVTDSAGDTWNATSQLMRHIVAYMRADVAVLRPSWFTVLEDITA